MVPSIALLKIFDFLDSEVRKYTQVDPEYIEALKEDIDCAISGVNRWTGNIDSMRSWVVGKYTNISEESFNQQFELLETLEYFK